ncbi:thioredoxin family protein [Salinicola avicenniae]|uniref:thioredoxin family protein n=1 Tax=Salinicola avicenniae TaxID=2916836 RepID=UPI002073FDD6|nr:MULTISPECIES: thioredoxin family protein [unclassified Salinicola]
MLPDYTTDEPDLETLRARSGWTVIEFGAPWCPWCQAARPLIEAVLDERPDLVVFRIEDGKGRPLGRAFGVKLWPTFVFLRDGEEIARCVRPESTQCLREALPPGLGGHAVDG